ncbi:hypothetical protein N2152v2_004155 [Parachlorella kessleri]
MAALGRVGHYRGEMTSYVLVVAVLAAIGGLLFGFDVGIVGGVEAMYEFQELFFPDILERTTTSAQDSDPWCVYNNHSLQLFSSCMFLAGAFAAIPAGHITRVLGRKGGNYPPYPSIPAGPITRVLGRKVTMVLAAILFLVGAGIQAGAVSVAMLVLGRVVLGFGVGSASQVVPMYISEAAPYRSRGALATLFQLSITVGIVVAQLINYGNQYVPWGWRLSLGLAGLPATLLLVGGLLLPESPNSLIERGQNKEGRRVLERLRGTKEVDAEYADICEAAELARRVSSAQSVRLFLPPWSTAAGLQCDCSRPSAPDALAGVPGKYASWANLLKRQYLPMTIVTVCTSSFQQLAGINSIMSASLLKAIVVGGVNVLATFVTVWAVDRMGRKPLLVQGGIQMMLALTGVAACLGVGLHEYSTISKPAAILTLVFICIYVAGFAWSWGPLAWVVGSEVHVMETRATGASLAVFFNFLFSFVVGQSFLACLCGMKWGVFIFFAGWVVLMTIFVIFFVPEMMGAPIEDHMSLFAQHWFWKRVMGDAADDVLQKESFRKAAFEQAERDHGDLRLVAAYYKALGLTGPD